MNQPRPSQPRFKVYLRSLGCPKNRVDSEVILAALAKSPKAQWQVVAAPEEADLIIVNTCAFIDAAQEESVNTILALAALKNAPPKAQTLSPRPPLLIVTGCLEQRFAQDLPQLLPEVDLFLAADEQPFIDRYVQIKNKQLIIHRAAAQHHPAKTKAKTSPQTKTSPKVPPPRPYYATHALPRLLSTNPGSAWLKIAEGCNRRCTFCAIPYFKGGYVSRDMNVLKREAQALVKQGAHEINLVAQDLSYYGKDLGLKNGLIHLLQTLEKIKGLRWIRLLYIYPEGLTPALIRYLKTSPKVCPYLDIPIQHLSDKILQAMGRRIKAREIKKRILNLRQEIPHIALRTSILVGFPGETDEDLALLQQGLQELQFDHLGVFDYSPQAETPAAKFDGQIKAKVKAQRQKLIYRIQQKIMKQRRKLWLGKTMPAIIEGHHPETDLLLLGRLITQAPEVDEKVIISQLQKPHQAGDIIQLTISQVTAREIVGQEAT
ncbi:MAG: 30S ribosomal protein S12 methylthiotransferase RimO [Bacteriovoracaceae bacterium]|nr:30S ribosomal protein S12 methylthiotransferase RimO [Bacteriovoracaceae bacterium]